MDYNSLNDYEIIYLIGENDDNAKEIMLKKYEPIVHKEAERLIASAKTLGLEFEDLVQEGYLAVALSFDKYNPDKNVLFYTYVLSAIRKRMLNIVRFNSTNKHSLLNNSLSLDFDIYENDVPLLNMIEDVNSNKPLEELEEKEYLNSIRRKLFNMSLLEASVFELKMNGFKRREIETLLHVNRRYINNVITKMRETLI